MARSKQQSSTLSLRPRVRRAAAGAPVSAWRKLPLTAQAAAAYTPRLEEGLPSNTSVRQTQWRGAPSPDNSMWPGSAIGRAHRAMGSGTDGGDVHLARAAGRTQAVAHGAPG